jgi:hypothetical protein
MNSHNSKHQKNYLHKLLLIVSFQIQLAFIIFVYMLFKIIDIIIKTH